MKFKNLLDNPKMKKIFAKKNKYEKVFILEKDDYRNAFTGELTERIVASKGIVIQKSETNLVNYLLKEKKVLTMQYAYQRKNKKEYIMSAKLTTTYIKAVLTDYYSSSKFVLKFPNYMIIFFGGQTQRVIDTSNYTDAETLNILESTFQGIPYVELDFFTFLALVTKKQTNLPFILLAVSLVFLGIIYTQTQDDSLDEYEYQMMLEEQARAVEKPKITNASLLGIFKSNQIIKNIYDVKLESGSIIGDVDIGQRRITIFSFAPSQNTYLKEHYFKKMVQLSLNDDYEELPYQIRSTEECLQTLGKHKEHITLKSIQSDKIDFLINNNNFDTDKLDEFLRDIHKCPIILREGYIRYIALNKRNVQLNIQLIKPTLPN
jgi:hypothetical protein